MTTTTTYCIALTKSGKPCRSFTSTGSEYCFTHDPKLAAQRAAAHSAGGKARHGRAIGSAATAEPVVIKNVADVVSLLSREINTVLNLEISLSRAQTISRLCLTIIKAFEVSEVQARLEAVEWALKLREKNPPGG